MMMCDLKIKSSVGRGDFQLINFRMESTEESLLSMGAERLGEAIAGHLISELRKYEIALRERHGRPRPLWLEQMRHCPHCRMPVDMSPKVGTGSAT